jgi:apyrase
MKNLISSLFILMSLATTAAAADNSYAIVVDAGSSGSRLHLFQYQLEKNMPVITEIFSENTKPGLSAFVSTPENAGTSLKILFDDALIALQKNNIDPHSVPVSVLATAGMRLLPEHTQEVIYANVKSFLQTSYPMPLRKIETISGKQEGVFGWLDINYLSGNFVTGNTVGSIDMGGASTQIAFATLDTSRVADEITLKIGEKTYTIFSKSFLGLGEDQALAAINQSGAMNSCYPVQFPLDSGIGNFDYATCSGLYTNLIEDNHVSEQLVPITHQNFIAYSGAYYNYNFFGVDLTPDQSSVEKSIQAVCTKSWEDLQRDYPVTPTKYLSTYCANMIYLDDLFYNTYQLQASQLQVATQINQHDIDWPLGALIYTLVTPLND